MFKKFLSKKIDIYILKEFIKIFLLMIFSIFLLILIIDFMEFSSKIQKYSIQPLDAIKIVVYRTPIILETLIQFIILLSMTLCLIKLSVKNELTIFYSNGFSSWNILVILSVFTFLFGLSIIFFFNFIFSNLNVKSTLIENKYIKKENRYFIESKNGIWFKQNYNNENIIIRASKVYVNDLIFKDLIFIFIDKNNNYSKRYNVDEAILIKDKFLLENIKVFKKNSKIEFIDKLTLETNITQDFIKKMIQNKYENIDLIPLINLQSVINDFKNLGFDTNKFVIYKHEMIIKPFIYVLMIFISILFSDSNNRNSNYLIIFLKTIFIGIVFFIIQNIIFELGSSNKINFILSTWGFLIISFIIIYTFLIKKIELENS